MIEEFKQTTEDQIALNDSESLRQLLEGHGFDTAQWGVGATKTVDALWTEVEEGETEIVLLDGELVRRTSVAAINVTARSTDGVQYHLREEKQVFMNGSERRRNLITSLAEKIKPGEDTLAATLRALHEELGIVISPANVTYSGEQVLEKNSQTFGGIRTQLLLKIAQVEIATQDFNPDGYVERQPDKSVYFTWEAIPDRNE